MNTFSEFRSPVEKKIEEALKKSFIPFEKVIVYLHIIPSGFDDFTMRGYLTQRDENSVKMVVPWNGDDVRFFEFPKSNILAIEIDAWILKEKMADESE